jgi:succinate dehydrogenase hydrophobic anchor subunit
MSLLTPNASIQIHLHNGVKQVLADVSCKLGSRALTGPSG